MPVISALKQRYKDCEFEFDLYSEIKADLECIERPCLRKARKTKQNKTENEQWTKIIWKFKVHSE